MKGQVKDRTIDNKGSLRMHPLTMCNLQYTEVHIFPIGK